MATWAQKPKYGSEYFSTLEGVPKTPPTYYSSAPSRPFLEYPSREVDQNNFYYAPKEAHPYNHEINQDPGQDAVVPLLVAGGVVGGVVGSKAIASQSKDRATAAQSSSDEPDVITTIHMYSTTSLVPKAPTTSSSSTSTIAATSADENRLIATTSSSILSTSSSISTLTQTAALADKTVTPFTAQTFNTFNTSHTRTSIRSHLDTSSIADIFPFQRDTYYKILNLEADPATPQALRSNATGPDDPWNNSSAVEPQQFGLGEQPWICQPVPSSWPNASIQIPTTVHRKLLYIGSIRAPLTRLAILPDPDLMDKGVEMEILFQPKDDANPEQYWLISQSLEDPMFLEFRNLAADSLWACRGVRHG